MTDVLAAPLNYVAPGGPVIDTRPACAAPGRRHPADAGYLCDEHLQDLNRWLHDVEDEVDDVDPTPSGGDPFTPGGGGAPAFTRAPVNLDALVLLSDRQGTGWAEEQEDRMAAGGVAPVLVVLTRWATYVHQHRYLESPPPTTVASARALLTLHLDWLAAQPVIGRVYRQIGSLRSALYRVNGEEEDQPLPGWCPQPVHEEECGGQLWPQDPDDDGRARVVCGRNPKHVWTGKEVAHLATRVRGQVSTPRKDALP